MKTAAPGGRSSQGKPERRNSLLRRLTIERVEHGTDFGFAFPAGPVFAMQLHEADRAFDRLFLRFQIKLSVAADDLFRLGERTIVNGDLSAGEAHAGSLSGGGQSAAAQHFDPAL